MWFERMKTENTASVEYDQRRVVFLVSSREREESRVLSFVVYVPRSQT